MVTGNDILSYQGNAALGLNSEGIDQYGDFDTKEINNMLFNIGYLNMQKNKEVWQQKLRDRDEGYKLIADGKLDINNVLPEDRTALRKKIQAIKDIYLKNGGDVKSNPDVWIELNDKLSDFNTSNNIAKTRLVTYQNGVAEAAKEKNPFIKKAMIEHWAGQLKNKKQDEPFDPYQQTMDYDVKKTLPGVALKISPAVRVGDNDVTETTTDVRKSIEDYVLAYVTNDKGETQPNVDAHYDDFFGMNGTRPVKTVFEDVAIVNDKLRKIAALEGYDISGKYLEGDGMVGPLPEGVKALPKYLQPIKVSLGENDEIDVSDRKDLAMAKINLALNYKREKTSVPNPKYAQIDKTKAEIKKIGADTDAAKALASQRRSTIPVNQAKAKYWNSKGTKQENENKVYNIFQDVMALRKSYKFEEGDKEIVWVGDMPEGFSKVLSGVNKKGEAIALKPLKRKNGAEYYEVGKSPFLIKNGKRYPEAEIKKAYKKQSEYTSYEEFFNHLINDAEFTQEDLLIGENGVSTAESTIQGLRALNNKNTSKGDETIYQDESLNNDNEE